MKNGKAYFTKTLLRWNKSDNKRLMPWKGETDPYKIWLSEIILQQTRVEQGWNYYNRFIAAYPNIKKLGTSTEQKVFKMWEGLGYYTRCKNLIATAKFISKERSGKFPETYDDILALKGVGPYTAAAIASFAFNLPHAVLDGNVFRVLSRYFGIETAIDSADGKKIFASHAHELLDKKNPGIYNQAIMDFGAVMCKPLKPLCQNCPLKTKCVARLQNLVDKLPFKETKLIKRTRWFYYLIIEHNEKIYVRKRPAKDIWENLYEFVLLETGKLMTIEEIKQTALFKKVVSKHKTELISISKLYKQQLTHQTIQGRFIHIKQKHELSLEKYKAVSYSKLAQLPFPKLITLYLAENGPKHL